MLLSNGLLLGEFIRKVHILVHNIFSLLDQKRVLLLVVVFLPAHHVLFHAPLVQIDQPQLHPLLCMVPVLAVLLPDLKGAVLDVAVAQVALPEEVQFSSSVSIFDQTLFSVLEFFFLGNLVFQESPCLFELPLSDRKFDCIEALLEKTLRPQPLHSVDKSHLLFEVLFVAGCVAPVLPRCELNA